MTGNIATIHSVAAETTSRSDWFSIAELADLALPGLPADKRGLARRARDERWDMRVGTDGQLLSRPRSGRGGGTEFNVALLPGAARLELAARGLTESRPEPAPARSAAADAWRWYDTRSAKVKAEAQRRVVIVAEVDVLTDSLGTRSAAVAEATRRHSVSAATLWGWLKMVDGVAKSDRLPALAPRRRGGGVEAEIDPVIWTIFKSDYLRPEEPTLAICYERTAAIAAQKGLSMPSERTVRRRLERDVDPRIKTRLRKGAEALRRSMPAQRRTVEHLHAMECVNIDGHKLDVFAIPPGGGKPMRPMLVGIQDVRSSKVLAWRLCEAESAHHVRLVFADLFEKFGIPVHCVLDNGRGFASKWITGGTANRFRFKVKAEDPTGLLVGLGVQVHWALPYHGQAKPIERAWLDLTDRVSRHPFCAGAYTGRSTSHKPENYGKRAIEWADLVAHVDSQIIAHNAKMGRRGRDYRGRSFDEIFAESYAAAPIGKATAEQLRMALLAAEQKLVNKQTGIVEMFGNRYYSEACSRLRGQRVTVRFDPDNLARDIHLYDLDGRYLASAQMWEDSGFLSAEDAKKTAKFNADMRKRVRAGVEAEQLLTAAQVAAWQTDAPAPEVPQAGATRPVRHRGQTAAALKLVPEVREVPQQSKVFAALERKFRVVE